MRQTGIFRRLFLCFFLCGFYFVSVAEEKEKLDPDKLQLLLDLSGEGSNKELERELALAVQAAWAENTPYHRYMFISSALDALGAMKSFSDFVDKSRQYDFALSLAQGTMLEKGVGRGQDNDVAASESVVGSAHVTGFSDLKKGPEVEAGKRAASCFAAAEAVIESLSEAERAELFKQFPPGELDLIREDNPWKKFDQKAVREQMLSVIAGMFLHGIIGVQPMSARPEKLPAFSDLPLEFPNEKGMRSVWNRLSLPRARERIFSIFRHWLDFNEEHAVVLDGLGEEKEGPLLFLKKTAEARAKRAMGDLAVALPSALSWGFINNLPEWMKKASESPYAVHIARQVFKTANAELNLANSAMDILKKRLKLKGGLDVALPAQTLENQFKDLFTNWKNGGLDHVRVNGLPIKMGTAFKAVGMGAAIWAAVDLTCKMGGALLSGQKKEQAAVADRKVSYTPRESQMQRTTDEAANAGRNRKYAFENAWEDYKEHLISNTTGIVTFTAVNVVGNAMVMGAAAAAGLPTAGVGGAVLGAAGFVVVGTVGSAVSESAKNMVSPLEKQVNDFLAKGAIRKGVWYIMSEMEYGADKKSVAGRIAAEMERRFRAGHPHRFMVLVKTFGQVEWERKNDGLVYFSLENKSGNLLSEVQDRGSVVGGVKKMIFRKITREAHVRYEYFDVDSNMSFWDAYSNQLVSVGKSSLSTNGLVFVGTGSQKIVFTNNEIRGVSSESDLRVLSNGILMARNEFSGEWEVRGKVFNTDIYLRGGKPGRYKWDDKTKSYRLIFTGRALSRDIGLDEKGRGVAAPRQTRTAASSRIRMRQRQKETREKASVSKEDVVTSAEVEEKSGWNLPSFLGINRK